MNPEELRLGNLLLDRGKPTTLKPSQFNNILSGYLDYELIPLTPETIEKYIDWEFELNFNKSVQQYEEWTTHWYLLENIIDGTSDFTIDFRINNKDCNLSFVDFYLDDKHLEFGLDDTIHNLQNLFYIISGQELPVKLN